MPTEPVLRIIPRELSQHNTEALEELAASCREVVNYASHIIEKAAHTQVEGVQYLPILMLFRHGIELVDSISVMIEHSCIDSCFLLLRGMLETQLSIEWITRDRMAERAKAYMLVKAHQDLIRLERLYPNTDAGRRYHARLRDDPLGRELGLSSYPFE